MGSDTNAMHPNTLNPALKKIPSSKLPPTALIWPQPEKDTPHSSDTAHVSPVPYNQNIRSFYVKAAKKGDTSLVPPPFISASEFVPPSLIEHLMRKKRGSALGEKFVPGAEITNMEGLMHTFVVPVVPRCETSGDYCYSFGHNVTPPVVTQVDGEKVLWTRSVVMSATIHLDFEMASVMMELCRLKGWEVVGRDLLGRGGEGEGEEEWKVLSKEDKQDPELRDIYDEGLRKHMVFHLMRERKLPAVGDKRNTVMSLEKALAFLSDLIADSDSSSSSSSGTSSIQEKVVNQFVKVYSRTLSLEILFASAFHQVCNEFSALEALCPQGYVYTYDPASIFAGVVGAELLNRVWILALKYLAENNQLANLRIVGFNNYADRPALGLVKAALKNQEHVVVVSKGELFQGGEGRFEKGVWKEWLKSGGDGGKYDVGRWEGVKGAMLVVHNNSDGFGQNVETEGMGGSLDGAIGASSSAAGSLVRTREDLLDWVV